MYYLRMDTRLFHGVDRTCIFRGMVPSKLSNPYSQVRARHTWLIISLSLGTTSSNIICFHKERSLSQQQCTPCFLLFSVQWHTTCWTSLNEDLSPRTYIYPWLVCLYLYSSTVNKKFLYTMSFHHKTYLQTRACYCKNSDIF